MKARKAKMTNRERRQKMLAAAWLFCHGQGSKPMQKKLIAKSLGTTATQITRWVEEAESLSIIQYRCNPPRVEALELSLSQKYPFLRDVIVVPWVSDFASARIARARQVAQYFESHVADGMTVSFAGGSTLYEAAVELPQRRRKITIVPAAIVGRGPAIDHIDPAVIVSIVWAKSGGTLMADGTHNDQAQTGAWAYSSCIEPYELAKGTTEPVAAAAIRRLAAKLTSKGHISEVLKRSRNADVLFTSCGPLDVDPEYRQYFNNTTLGVFERLGLSKQWLKDQGIVADICYSPLDRNGKGKSEWKFFPAVGPDDLSRMAANMRKRVVVTAGPYSTQGVRAVLAGRLCNVLIIDEKVAVDLLNADISFGRVV